MRHALLWLVVVLAGPCCAPAALAQEPGTHQSVDLTEQVVRFGYQEVSIPRRFGRLVSVVESSEVHHLYFQDDAGVVRIVLIGRASAVQQARREMRLLSPVVQVIPRTDADVPRPDTTAP